MQDYRMVIQVSWHRRCKLRQLFWESLHPTNFQQLLFTRERPVWGTITYSVLSVQVRDSEVSSKYKSNTDWIFWILLMVYMFGRVRQNFSLAQIAKNKKW